jgi:hypothetical protein
MRGLFIQPCSLWKACASAQEKLWQGQGRDHRAGALGLREPERWTQKPSLTHWALRVCCAPSEHQLPGPHGLQLRPCPHLGRQQVRSSPATGTRPMSRSSSRMIRDRRRQVRRLRRRSRAARATTASLAVTNIVLNVNGIEVIYNHVILVLKGVSLQVPEGKHCRHPGRQRRRQDHHAARRLQPAARVNAAK